jgi:hypothetical protein
VCKDLVVITQSEIGVKNIIQECDDVFFLRISNFH